MELAKSAPKYRSEVALYSILFLIFFQLITDFVAAIYAFGLLETNLPAEIASVLLLLSPLILLLFRRGISGLPLVIIGEVILASRVLEVMLDTRGRMIVAGVGSGCFLLLLPSLLHNLSQEDKQESGVTLSISITIALSVSILLRAIGSGTDISVAGWTQVIGWVLALAGGVLLLGLAKSTQPAPDQSSPVKPRAGKVIGLSLGLTAVLVLLYFAFISPNVIARWTGASYLLILATTSAVLLLFAFLLSSGRLKPLLTPRTVLIWNALFVLSMTLTIIAHQIGFPATPSAYPLAEPVVTVLHHIPLVVMLLTLPVLLIDFGLLIQELDSIRPTPRALGGGFSVAAFYMLVMVFAHVFTTVYDYIPVVGPFFRDKFWLVYLLAGLAVALPTLLVRPPSFSSVQASSATGNVFPAAILLLGLATIAGALLTTARPPSPPDQATTLTVLTYNVQQGYSEDGLLNLDGQLEAIRQENPDIVGLQESDTNRIAGGNIDLVRYFADGLDMYSYYGPKTVPGTFGIALLSRYPIQNPRTFYMYSEGEQTATIAAQITVGEETFNVFVTHLGNGGPLVQQEAILQEVEGLDNVVAMGDFNFRPDTDQYALTTTVLDDSWLLRWPDGAYTQGIEPADRIDHIFVSAGTMIADSRYLASPESDHPAMVTVIEW